MNILVRSYRFLGSGILAIALIAILAGVLIAATFYESNHGTAAAGSVFYHTAWFAALLLLIGVNVTLAAVGRWPWQPKHAGFLITHLAIDTLLVGALMTVASGVDGTITLAEGASSGQIALSDYVVRSQDRTVPARPGATLALTGGAVVKVEDFIPYAQRRVDVVADGAEANPAIHFKVGNKNTGTDGWLVAHEDSMNQESLGPLHLSFREVAELPSESAEPTLRLILGKVDTLVPVKEGATCEIAGTAYKVRVVKIYDHAVVDGKKLVENPRGNANPAVRFELLGKGAPEQHIAFANFPDFATYRGHGTPPSGLKVHYQKGAEKGPSLAFYRMPDGKLQLRMAGKTLAVARGETIATPWMGMTVQVDQVIDKARVSAAFVASKEGQGMPAILLASGNERMWLGQGDEATIAGAPVRCEAASLPLSFQIKLKKFIMTTDPGTNSPASFASEVEVVDGGKTVAQRIQMNEPLRYGGYTFFQSGYQGSDGNGPTVSILQVSKDPGMMAKYAGTFLLVLGIIWLFYLEPVLARRRAAARRAVPVAETASPVRARRASTAVLLLLALTLSTLPAAAAQRQGHGAAPKAASKSGACPVMNGGDSSVARAPAAAAMPTTPAQEAPAGHPTMGSGQDVPAGHASAGGHGAKSAPDAAATPTAAVPLPPPTALNLDPIRRLAVQYSGRVRPFDTFAREIVMTITGRDRLEDREAADLVLSWTVSPQAWQRRAVVYVPNKTLKKAIGLDTEPARFSLADLARSQELLKLAEAARRNEKSASATEREAATVVERAGMLQAVFSGRLMAMVPPNAEPSATWQGPADMASMDEKLGAAFYRLLKGYQEGDARAFPVAATEFESLARAKGGSAYPSLDHINMELTYNRLRPFRTSWELYVAAVVLLGLGSMWPSLRYLAAALGFGGLLVHTAGFGLRILISGRAPVTNMYESVVYVAWGVAVIGTLIAWRYRAVGAAVAAAVVSSLLLVLTDAMPGALDPSIQPLMPVLRNNFWLTVHVLTITMSYAAFTLACGLGHAWLVVDRLGKASVKRVALGKFLNATLRIGVLLLAAGTLLGGVWASYSWGRFWGWDPKEVWALIALLGYLIILHGQYTGWVSPRGLAIGSILGFLGVLMAWYGVNYVLGTGLHSYGFGSGGVQYAAYYVVLEVLFILATTGHRSRKETEK